MLRRLVRKGLSAARTAADMGKGLIFGAPGVGHGVADYEDFERLRAEAAAQDRAEGAKADDGSDLEAIEDGTAEIGAEELRILLEVEQQEDHPVLLDVREPHEWRAGRLIGALHIPLGRLAERLHEVPDRPVVAYCASGMRSIDASYVLKRAGRTDVRSLAGGIGAWERAGNAVERG